MKRFMLVGIADGRQFARFSDSYNEVLRWKSDTECGFGGYAEIYVRTECTDGCEYRLSEA